jgi:hypothetical protein
LWTSFFLPGVLATFPSKQPPQELLALRNKDEQTSTTKKKLLDAKLKSVRNLQTVTGCSITPYQAQRFLAYCETAYVMQTVAGWQWNHCCTQAVCSFTQRTNIINALSCGTAFLSPQTGPGQKGSN